MVRHKKKAPRSKTRHKFRKKPRQRGMPNVNLMLQNFDEGDVVHVNINPSVHRAMPFRRFIGKTGTVVGSRGECYFVVIKDGRAKKKILVHPVHLKLQKKAEKKTEKTVKPKPKKTKQ